MTEELALYLHLPFCRSKCPYCDFYSGEAQALGVRPSAYCAALTRELEIRLGLSPTLAGQKLHSLYFGGGTPGMIDPENFAPLIDKVHSAFSATGEAEITLELNPGGIDQAQLQGFIRLGINRFSIGAQSFSDRLLKQLGRVHQAAATRSLIEELARCGIARERISLDLIFAVPGQSIEDWQADLEEAAGWQCGHLSLYGLTFHEDTPFAKRKTAGELREVDEETQVAMYRLAKTKLTGAGYEHYELSNFALPGCRSRHNLKYWTGGEYLGLGAGAHSCLNGQRFHNLPDAAEYVRTVNGGKLFTEEEEPLSERSRLGERMMLGLRLVEGVAIAEFNAECGVDLENYYRHEITQLDAQGLLERCRGNLRLTDRGLLLADQVMADFF